MRSTTAALDGEARRALMIGAVLAAVVMAVPFLRFVFSYMIILVHELGHALFAWIFGYPAIPSFDFYYGGGFTSWDSRNALLLVLINAGWAVALWVYRRHRPALVVLSTLLALYSLCAVTRLHQHVIGFMGHGAELVFAGIFLYRALSGSRVKIAAERPLYAFLAFFIVASDLRFAVGLARSPLEREIYAEAKGGGHVMDFSRLAEGFQVELYSVAGLFAVLAMAALPLAWLVYRHREAIGGAMRTTFLDPWYSS